MLYVALEALLLIKQRYKMKAIHNGEQFIKQTKHTVVNKAKIQNESNSQRLSYPKWNANDCC